MRSAWLFFLAITLGYATVLSAETAIASQNFDTEVATKWLDNFEAKFDVEEADVPHLREAISALENWQKGAKSCVDLADTAISNVQTAATAAATTSSSPLSESVPGAVASNAAAPDKPGDTAEKTYLENKIASINDTKSRCKIIVLRTQEMLDNYRSTLDQMARLELLSGGPEVWVNKIVPYDLTQFPALFLTGQFPWSSFLGLDALNGWLQTLYILMPSFGFFVGLFFWWHFNKKIPHIQTETVSGKMVQAFYAVCARYVIPLCMLSGLLATSSGLWVVKKQAEEFILFVASVMAYFLLVAAVDFIFSPPPPAVHFNKVPPQIGKRIRRNVRWLGLWILISANLYILHNEVRLNFTTLFTISLTSMTIIALNLSLLTNHMRELLELHAALKWIERFLCKALQAALMLVIVTSWLAYQHLAFYLMKGILLSMASVAVLWFAYSLLHAIFPGVSETKPNWQRILRYRLGIPSEESLLEFTVIRFAFHLTFLMAALIIFADIWGVSDGVRLALREAMWQGFSFSGIPVIPVRIVFGLLAFGVFIFATRILSHLVLKEATSLERGAREAYSAMVNYVGWGIGLLCALTLAGVNLAGLAIVAGALSVGIGFGLQNIVNNFVSGVILLIERPIKIGDRVSVGDTEGIVKKISIRSTQITTNAQADVVVPNSDLITRQVTNFMFRDQRARVSITVYVSHGGDVNLICDTLLAAANSHADVLKKEGEEPVVQLAKLAEQNMVFELAFTIRDVNRKGAVRSDINMNIEKAFKLAGLSLSSSPTQVRIIQE